MIYADDYDDFNEESFWLVEDQAPVESFGVYDER